MAASTTVWMMTRHEPAAGIVEYVARHRAPNRDRDGAMRAAAPARTRVTVIYVFTGLRRRAMPTSAR